jgi:hypothetical protein
MSKWNIPPDMEQSGHGDQRQFDITTDLWL